MRKTYRRHAILCTVVMVMISAALAQVCQSELQHGPSSPQSVTSMSEDESGRHLIPERWWETAAGIKLVTLKKGRRFAHEISIDPERASEELDRIKAEGFQAIEIFAPAEGLYGYNGLDTVNHYRIDPEIGTMDHFRQFIRIAHDKGLAVIAFVNVGYFSLEAPDWIEACKNPESEKAKWFIWADSPNAPIPPEHPYFNWPRGPESPEKTWGWQYSELADRYFWAKWQTKDEDGNWVGLPQNDWGYEGWAEEVEKIIRCWMDTGLDGLTIDAPIYYIGMTWEKNNRRITDVMESYGNTFRQPEGSQRAGWITEGNYNCMIDYGIGEWTEEGDDAIDLGIKSGDPRAIEDVLRRYRDVRVAHGGVLYKTVRNYRDERQRHLYRATLAAVGDILVYTRRAGSPDAEETWILNTKHQHPALQQLGPRRKLPTNADDKYYAFLRTAPDNSERVLVVLNFQSTPQTVEVDLAGMATSGLVELRSAELIEIRDSLNVELPAYGYAFYQVLPAQVAATATRPNGSETLSPEGSLRHLVDDRWWETASALQRVTLKPGTYFTQISLKPAQLARHLDEIQAQGFSGVELFAPAEGGPSYAGLDARNRYRIDREIGTMDDFRRLVRAVHSRGMAIIVNDNLGYCSVEAPEFLKACDDVRAGKDSEEARWFLWSESPDAPPPATSNPFFMIRPTHVPGWEPGTFYDSKKGEFWQYSERAGRYYWTKWGGVDEAGNRVRLPQYNFGGPEFQEEAESVIRFWMDTGLDGMVLDAVNWYVGCTWEDVRRRMTDVIKSYGNTYVQPEGAGGFLEDPVAWVTAGGFNSVQDYGLTVWWVKGTNVIANAIERGDPSPIEPALRNYHDRVVAEGAALYICARAFFNNGVPYSTEETRHLGVAVNASLGNLLVYGSDWNDVVQKVPDQEETWILNTKRLHPALHQLSIRRKLPTSADDKCYAFMRTAADKSERILVVMNFQPTPQTFEVDLSGVAASGLVELKQSELIGYQNPFKVTLPAYGYRFYQVLSMKKGL